MKTNRMKRAPAPLWAPLCSLLSGLEVGASGELRLPVEPPPSREINSWDQTAEPGEVVIYRGWPCRLVESRGKNKAAAGELTPQRLTPPLRPGRYWVPEEWWASPLHNGLYQIRYQGAMRHLGVWPPEGWQFPSPTAGWLSPHQMPKWAARLACSVGEERVEAWCGLCGGEGKVPYPAVTLHGDLRGNPPSGYAKWDGKSTKAKPCPACGGTPPPTWVYEVERTEVVSDA